MAEGTGVVGHLEAALRAAGVRQAIIANNIANLGTPGYRRREVPFEQVFAEALDAGKPVDQAELLARIVEPRTGPLNEQGNDVELDAEVGDLVKNSMMYKTYMRLLGRVYRQMEIAIQG